jgi:hypothetical protein
MFSGADEVDMRSPGARSERIRFEEELNESGGDGREAELMKLRDGGHDFVSKLLKIFPVFWVSGKPHRGAVDHSDRSKGVPPSIPRHSFSAANDVNRNDGNVRPRSDQPDSRFGFRKISVERPTSFGKEDKRSLVFEDLKNILEGGGAGRFLIHRDRADGGKKPRSYGRCKKSVASEVVGDSAHAAADGGWIEEAGMIGS